MATYTIDPEVETFTINPQDPKDPELQEEFEEEEDIEQPSSNPTTPGQIQLHYSPDHSDVSFDQREGRETFASSSIGTEHLFSQEARSNRQGKRPERSTYQTPQKYKEREQ